MASGGVSSSSGGCCLKWSDLEVSCRRLDQAEIRIESLDLSSMEMEGDKADSRGSNRQSFSDDEDACLSAEAAVARLGAGLRHTPFPCPAVAAEGWPTRSPGPPFPHSLGQYQGPVEAALAAHCLGPAPVSPALEHTFPVHCLATATPGADFNVNMMGPRAIQHSDSWGSVISRTSTFKSDSSAGSGVLQSELSICSDTGIMSPIHRLRNEPVRAISEKIHRLAMSNSCWEEETSASGSPVGTPTHSGTPGLTHSRSQLQKAEWDNTKSLGAGLDKLHRLAVSSSGEMKLRRKKGPKRTSSEVSRKTQEIQEVCVGEDMGRRRLTKGTSYPRYHEKEQKIVIPSIMAEIDPTWDLWEGKGDFSGSGKKEEPPSGWESKGPKKGSTKGMFSLFSKKN